LCCARSEFWSERSETVGRFMTRLTPRPPPARQAHSRPGGFVCSLHDAPCIARAVRLRFLRTRKVAPAIVPPRTFHVRASDEKVPGTTVGLSFPGTFCG
jgi:hypothetical protein